MRAAFIALGSNLSCPQVQIQIALEYLAHHPKITLLACASLYTNPPLGIQEQPDFVNTVALIETSLNPYQLLETLLSIEKAMGRQRTVRWGPRIIDLDIVLYEDCVMTDEDLVIPHPQMKERDFVLWPLFEIAPDLILPDGTPLRSLIHEQPETLIEVKKDKEVL